MSLRSNQRELVVGRLYETASLTKPSPSIINPNIWFEGGRLAIYISQSGDQPTAIEELTLTDSGVKPGVYEVLMLPRWLYVVADLENPSPIILTGLEAIDMGEL